jgi:hypothetical protein
MNNIIETRKKIYRNFPKENLEISLNNIVLAYNINDNDYDQLINNIKAFVIKSLTLVNNKNFIWNDTFLEDNDELINNLPNKTPNGIINPKQETINEYNNIQISINKILKNLNLDKHIKSLAVFNLRYKSANEPQNAQNRPYYTSKYHSDAWVGHVGDSIFIFGALGDIDNNTVEFNEPINVHDNYLDKAENFDEGNTRYESFKYLGTIKKQQLGVMDHACLHRTLVKENSKPRLSIDIAVMIDSEYSHANNSNFSSNSYQYHPLSLIQSVGINHKINVKESIFDNNFTTTLIIE